MKRILFTLAFTQLLLTSWAENVELKLENKNNDSQIDKFQIPAHVYINDASLNIYFGKVKHLYVVVTCPEGVVYQREIATETEKSIYIDLSQYKEGGYTIYFLDSEGNSFSGDFMK